MRKQEVPSLWTFSCSLCRVLGPKWQPVTPWRRGFSHKLRISAHGQCPTTDTRGAVAHTTGANANPFLSRKTNSVAAPLIVSRLQTAGVTSAAPPPVPPHSPSPSQHICPTPTRTLASVPVAVPATARRGVGLPIRSFSPGSAAESREQVVEEAGPWGSMAEDACPA